VKWNNEKSTMKVDSYGFGVELLNINNINSNEGDRVRNRHNIRGTLRAVKYISMRFDLLLMSWLGSLDGSSPR